jgi:RNA polymerase sigma-70 factor (ECF subfamily)
MRQLYDHCAEPVYGLMVRMVGRQDADDLTQQVFLQAFRKLDQFRGGSSLQTWLYRLAANEALQHLRREKLRRTQPLEMDPRAQALDDSIDASDRIEVVQSALARLDPELRLVLALKEEQQLSYRQIAETLNIPEGTVGSRLNRARQELRTELIRLGWEPV